MLTCTLCGEVILDSSDPSIWKQVVGWVGGPRKDSMRLRENTGKYAHNRCVAKVQSGQAVDQPDMFTGTPETLGTSWVETMENDFCL